MWLALLNESYFQRYKIKRRDIIGYLVIEPEDLKIQYEKNPPDKSRRYPDNYLPKDWRKRKRRISQRQTGGFLNRYDFAYAVRDTVNQVGKIASGIINKVLRTLIKLLNKELIRQSEQMGQKSNEKHQKYSEE